MIKKHESETAAKPGQSDADGTSQAAVIDGQSQPEKDKKEEKKKVDDSVHSQLTSSLMESSDVDEKEAKKDKDKKKKALSEA